MKKLLTVIFLVCIILSKSLPFIYRSYNPRTRKIETYTMYYKYNHFVIMINLETYMIYNSLDYTRNEIDLMFHSNMWKLNRLIYPNKKRIKFIDLRI